MSKVDLFVFRHGETQWNRERRFQGHTDIPLNEIGRSQAQGLSEKFKLLDLELILSSDLSRARETAEIAMTTKPVPLILTPHLRECRLGDPEGMHRDDVLTKFGEDSWHRWISIDPQDWNFAFPNGESKVEHLERMVSYIESYLFENSHLKRVGISTHGGSLRRLIHHCKNAPKEPAPIPNCALYQLEFDHNLKSWSFKG